jgi:hypothetical protein
MTHAEVAKRIEKAIVSWLASPMASIGSGARRPLLFPKVFPANYYKKRADERTRTAYPCSSYEKESAGFGVLMVVSKPFR